MSSSRGRAQPAPRDSRTDSREKGPLRSTDSRLARLLRQFDRPAMQCHHHFMAPNKERHALVQCPSCAAHVMHVVGSSKKVKCAACHGHFNPPHDGPHEPVQVGAAIQSAAHWLRRRRSLPSMLASHTPPARRAAARPAHTHTHARTRARTHARTRTPSPHFSSAKSLLPPFPAAPRARSARSASRTSCTTWAPRRKSSAPPAMRHSGRRRLLPRRL